MKRLIHALNIFSLALILLSPGLVFAQTTATPTTSNVPEYKGVEGSIAQYLCTPSDANDGHDLERCINKMYRFGVSFGGLALVFFLVFAGYMYMTGGESGKTKAKGILQNSLVGIGVLLGSFVLLRFINPSLVVLKPIQPPIFTANEMPTCNDVGLGQDCVLPNGDIAAGNGSGGGTSYANCPSQNLVAVTGVKTDGGVGKICATLLEKLVKLKTNTSSIPWLVSSVVDGKHLSNCHKPGNAVSGVCADLAMDGGRIPSYTRDAGSTNPKWGELCQAVKALGGITIANEAAKAPQCPGYKPYPTTTGPNLHIFLSK